MTSPVTLPAVAAPARPRIPLPARISEEGMALLRAQWAEIDAYDATERNGRQDFVSQPSRFVGVKSGLPSYTTS